MTAPYLLSPKVKTRKIEMITAPQLKRLLANIKKRKFGAMEVAVDVEEVVTTKTMIIEGRYRERVLLPAGSYFNVHVEYVI